ncbi:OmpA family protein [Allonocardiopsis opalescens]|uniref:Outer membrane protein OmpA-like peptidoglycan-associated protein n=1 Tax=Allonocardiopsis opalescens TaxID=1144618 RepID=A0A2T0PZN6_9ACTN|nr:OmpA family protein [Allonocardiopsis opalescens]PRX96998.1 outer membrane protein OmpA-like peptidoglycan-associated protein [Allonocardiopsis opalescens]
MRPRERAPRRAGPRPRTGPVLALAAAAAVPALMAADSRPQEWPSPPEINIAESVHGIPFEEPEPFTYGIPLDTFIRPVRTEQVEAGVTTVSISSDVLFAFDEAELGERALATVEALAAEIQGAGGTVTVVGHTDGVGDDDYNAELSRDRAEAVRAALQQELGDGTAIEAEGRGAEEPVAEETGSAEEIAAAQAENRRVEISYEGR